MKPYIKTWRIIAGAGAAVWRGLAEQAAADAKLAALMKRVAEALDEVEKYLVGKEEK